jgi:mannose-6-phosphate isomerase-like protein (cupin superfamily)
MPRTPYIGNIVNETKQNAFFRRVLYTGDKSQLVVMDIKPGEDVGMETHAHVEQTLFFLSGTGMAVLDGVETPIKAGDVVVVPPGTEHDFVNTGNDSLKIYTIYSPPNHFDGRIHKTKADAEADVEDEAYGESVR